MPAPIWVPYVILGFIFGNTLKSGNAGSGNLCGRADMISGHNDSRFKLIEKLATIRSGEVKIGAVKLTGQVTALCCNRRDGAGFSYKVERHGILGLSVFLFQTRQILGLPYKER